MITVRQDLGLDNWHDPSTLTDGSVTSQDVSVLQNGELARTVLLDLQHASPLGELASIFFVLDATGLETVETLSGAFVVGAE